MRTDLLRHPVFVLLLASIAWGCTWWPLKQVAAMGVGGVPQILVAYGTVALLMLPLLLLQYTRWRPEAHYLLLVFLLGGAANLAFAWSLLLGDVVRVMVLFYLLPVWSVLGGRFFLGERIDALRGVAVAMSLTGAFLVLGGPSVLAAPPSWIDLAAIASGFLFAMNNICFRAAQQAPLASKVGATFAGCALFAALLIAGGAQSMPEGVPGSSWGFAAGLGLLLLCVTLGSQYGVTHLEAGRASVIIIVELLTATLTAAWWAGDTLHGVEWIGGALILVAAVLEARRPTTDTA
ncbi:MAG: DMT family transporter [Pseudomonadota bacterium]